MELAKHLSPSAGSRNILVHEYIEADLDRVCAAVPLALDGYKQYVIEVAKYLSTHNQLNS